MSYKLRTTGIAAALAAAVMAAGGSPAMAAAPELSDPIKIALFDWTSVNLNANILGGILKRLGYNVEYVPADYISSLTTGLTTGDITIALEYWDTTAGEGDGGLRCDRPDGAPRHARAEGEGGVVVSAVYEG